MMSSHSGKKTTFCTQMSVKFTGKCQTGSLKTFWSLVSHARDGRR